MYCLEKLQRELAYFFDMDLRELPRVQDLLAAQGYTQVQKGDEIIKLEPSAQADSTPSYTDTKGHTHQIPSDIAQQWLETFGLKDLQETYTPKFSEQVAQALEPILQGEQISLSANSLVKLMQRDRLEFLPYIKETLEHSDIIIKDKENALIFAKDIGQTSYFTSVSKNDKGEWVISTNSYKTLSQLKNRVSENGEVLYLSKEAPNILAETFTTKAFSNELASDIIPQQKPYTDEKKTLQGFEQAIAGKDTPTPPTQKGLFDEVDSSLAAPKQKTIEKVDSYAKSDEFKSLSKDKQEAILSLKTIEPNPMPQEITQENLENLFRHFNSKQDKAQREFYAKLFNDTKENPHITLEVKRDNETRQEYIKAYQHKDTHDLYYIAITKENDTIKVTGYPITKIKDVINQIKNAEKVVWRHQGDQTHTALDSKESLSLENAKAIIPQEKKLNTPSDLGVEFGGNFAEYFSTPRSLANQRTRNALRELYHASEKSQENLALFDKVLEVAGNLKVKTQGKPTRDSAGVYYPAENRLTIRTHMPTRTHKAFGVKITQGGQAMSEEDIAQTLLHELIHSTISTAQLALTHKDFAPMAKALTQEQKHALEEIHTLYKLIKREHSHAKKWHTLPINDTYYYGLKNEREFIAELANPNFRDYLQRQNIFMRVINAVLKFFTKAKAKPTDTPTTALESLQNAYMKFLENFNYEHYISTRQEVLKGIKDEIQERKYKVDSSEPSFTYTTGEAKGIAELRKDLKQALEPYKSTPITNKETGLQGVVTDTERNKISSKKAVDKSIANGFTRDEHFAAAQDLKNLFENATKAQSHNDYKQRENIAQVHRFVKDLYINDKPAQAKITLFEKIEGKNRIYTLELESLENPTPLSSSHAKAGAAVEAQVTRDVVRPNANIAKTDGDILP